MEMVQEKRCENCGYFRQHYIWREDEYMKVADGHCTHPPRIRRCKSEMKACEKWIPQTEEYLNKYYPQ